MGILVPTPPVYGADCAFCTPDPFLPDETPEFVTATISGDWTACPLGYLPDDVWVLKQSLFAPCTWELTSGPVYCLWTNGIAVSYFFIYEWEPFGHPKFFSAQGLNCATHYESVLTEVHCGQGDLAFGGVCDITW